VTKRFGGFQIHAQPAVPVPRDFFTDVLPQLGDVAEIQVSLAFFRIAAEAGGLESPIAERTIVRDRYVRQALRVEGSPNEPDRRIAIGLDLAVGRGTLLRFSAGDGAARHVWYYVNTPGNQALIAGMTRGTVAPPRVVWTGDSPPVIEPERPTVFRLYEQNIGLLTPLIAERLVDALETYPPEWIEDAIAEAVQYNRRSWRYVNRILENWAVTGRGDSPTGAANHEAHRRRDADVLDPAQYQHGRYLDRTRRR
jgi:DNA replication protein